MKQSHLLGAIVAGAALSAAPFAIEVGGEPAVPRIVPSVACAQASSCAPLDDYVCSTYHKDWEDKTCYTGCGNVEPEG